MRISLMSKRRFCALVLATSLVAALPVLGQDAEDEESDQEFLSRIQDRLDRIEYRIDDVDMLVEQRMGSTAVTSNRIGASATNTPGRMSSDPTSSEFRRMRLELRSMKKKVSKERERMMDQYNARGDGEFDRGHWDIIARRFEKDLDDMVRELRR